jgi:hypothetical protein
LALSHGGKRERERENKKQKENMIFCEGTFTARRANPSKWT